ncbi:MAG: TIGR04283 family arsenosugar biosynthesis glycosyltransferase [Elainellaceae cyanobacterium]
MRPRVSIIIPTLNESTCLGQTLRHLSILDPPAWEIIVVDGGSRDRTVSIADAANVSTVLSKQARRSCQMNQGVAVATGEFLCFLHADTWVPEDLIALIHQTLNDSTIACGGFVSLMTGTRSTRWGISLHNYLKTYYAPLIFRPHLFFGKGLKILFGDQAMFCRATEFRDCGGFDPDLPIMEDADLCRKLVRYGRIHLVHRVVQSSDRRVAKWGAVRATLLYLWIGVLWGVGVSASYLEQFYDDVR